MKTIKVTIRDENTLALLEDAQKGDIIDLKSIHKMDIDKTAIETVVNSIKQEAFNTEVLQVTEGIKRESALELSLKEKEIIDGSNKELAEKDIEIAKLKAQINASATSQELAIIKAVKDVEKDRDELKVKIANQETQIKDRDDAIERLKDMKTRLSTKMIGECLEQHCQNEFNKIRATAFPNSYFEKDNDSSSGSKGDYIFRDPSSGIESVSIMFDMKNENDTTGVKKKNEDFIAKLDKDRNEKGCEYAILVSMLEADNDLYNQGIVDVSHKYPKMYVIRPQFFIPMISLLKNAAEKSLAVKNELAIVKNQNIDITTFEDDVNNWKAGWLNSMKNAGKKHLEAVDQINKAIKDLEKVRDALTMTDKHLLTAENKIDELTVKRLTRKNPTMEARFEELGKIGSKRN